MIREIKKEIKAELDSLAKTYFAKADADNIYPHIIFDFPTQRYQEGQSVYSLDVDVWDSGLSTARIDELYVDIIKKLDRLHIIGEKSNFAVWHTGGGTTETKTELLRRTLFFEVHVRSKING